MKTNLDTLKNLIGNNKVEYILDYDNFFVVKAETRYFYFTEDQIIEVKPIAELYYSIVNDIRTDKPLDYLFDCLVCGEQITDEEIIYWWFTAVNE